MRRFIEILLSIVSFFRGRGKPKKVSNELPSDNYPMF